MKPLLTNIRVARKSRSLFETPKVCEFKWWQMANDSKGPGGKQDRWGTLIFGCIPWLAIFISFFCDTKVYNDATCASAIWLSIWGLTKSPSKRLEKLRHPSTHFIGCLGRPSKSKWVAPPHWEQLPQTPLVIFVDTFYKSYSAQSADNLWLRSQSQGKLDELRLVLAAKSGRVKDPSKHVDIFRAAILASRMRRTVVLSIRWHVRNSESTVPISSWNLDETVPISRKFGDILNQLGALVSCWEHVELQAFKMFTSFSQHFPSKISTFQKFSQQKFPQLPKKNTQP